MKNITRTLIRLKCEPLDLYLNSTTVSEYKPFFVCVFGVGGWNWRKEGWENGIPKVVGTGKNSEKNCDKCIKYFSVENTPRDGYH